jgi:peptidylprolyl isomerase
MMAREDLRSFRGTTIMPARRLSGIVLLASLAWTGCAEDRPTSPGSTNRFAPLNEANAKSTELGVRYEDLAEGEGEPAKAHDIVQVHYTGYLTDGTKFDSSHDRRTPFRLILGIGNVIRGWDDGVAGMKPGSKRKLHIPAKLGYGERGAGDKIPPNADLIFDVELVSILPGPRIEDLKIGEGESAQYGDVVRVHYVGKLANGMQFDSSIGREPFTLQIGRSDVIQGWHAGIPGMKEGGKRRLTIPPELGYGEDGNGDVIPPNATLVFDIELLKIRR